MFEKLFKVDLDSLSLLLVILICMHENFFSMCCLADFKSIELRLVAHFSEDKLLLSILNSKKTPDVFVHLASAWYVYYRLLHV